MRHVAVRRLTVLLGIVCLVCAVAFAWLVHDDSPPPSAQQGPIEAGAALFARHCGTCHAAEDLRPSLAEGGAERRRSIDAFLRNHGETGDADDRLILDYLSAAGS